MLALVTVAMVPLYVGKNDVTLALPYPGTAILSTYPFIPTLDDVILLLSEIYTLTSSLIESAISPSVSNTPGAVPINVAILADTASSTYPRMPTLATATLLPLCAALGNSNPPAVLPSCILILSAVVSIVISPTGPVYPALTVAFPRLCSICTLATAII